MKKNTLNYKEIEALAKNGLSNREIAEALNICEKSFYNYLKKDTHFTVAIKKGKSYFKQKIRKALLSKATTDKDTTALIFLTKRLGLLKDDGVELISLKSSKDVLKAFETLFNSNVPIEQKSILKSILDSYVKSFETLELQERLEKLEELYDEKHKKQTYKA